jgi:hypothetical protein
MEDGRCDDGGERSQQKSVIEKTSAQKYFVKRPKRQKTVDFT